MKIGHYGTQRSGTNVFRVMLLQAYKCYEFPAEKWKHGPICGDADINYIVARHPMAWLESFYRYCGRFYQTKPLKEFMRSRITVPEWLQHMLQTRVLNPLDHYRQMYTEWLEGDGVLVRYEDLILNPNSLLETVRPQLGPPESMVITVPESKVDPYDQGVKMDSRISDIQNEKWRNYFDEEDIQFAEDTLGTIHIQMGYTLVDEPEVEWE